MLQKLLSNLKTKYQILVPVLATIVVMMLAIYLVNSKLESTNRNVQISDHRSYQLSNVSIAESRLLFLRLSVSAGFTNIESLKTIDFDGINSELNSNFTNMVNQQRTLQNMGAAVKSPEQLQSELNLLISQLNDYKKYSDEIVKYNDKKIKELREKMYAVTA